MTIPFDTFFQRVVQAAGISSQTELARALGVNRSAITQAKNRDAVPPKWVLALSRCYSISPDWLEFGTKAEGTGNKSAASSRPGLALPAPRVQQRGAFAQGLRELGESILIPKVQARLCAGGGSFEIEAVPVSEHPFPRAWLSRMGSPESMVFMDVIGNSMEPAIYDGDMVLVDQSVTQTASNAVMAVGYEDAIYIKRLEQRPRGLALISDNPEYAPMELAGDEMAMFRVIGRVVWLCRDCRYM